MQPDSPPHLRAISVATSYWGAQALRVMARLGLADLIASGTTTLDGLASKTGARAETLGRLLRALGALGFVTTTGGRYGLTETGAALETGAPGAARATVLAMTSPWMWNSFAELEHSVKTGETAFEKVYGKNAFAWLGEHPEDAALFNDAMVGIHGEEPAAVAAAYDFSAMKTVVDVGGGTGGLLSGVLAAHGHLDGMLLELPHVAKPARERLASLGLASRTRVVEGSFFEEVPPGGDAYFLSHVIHDWDEERCAKILGCVKRAMKPGAKLLLVEMVLPEGDGFHPGKLLDLVMLAAPGGRERTADEYRALLAESGFELTRVVPTRSPVSVVEARLR